MLTVALLIFSQSAPLLPTVTQEGLVLSVSGEGRIERPGEEPVPLLAGERLPQGALVCTDTGSFATVRLALHVDVGAHDDIMLMSETCLVVRSLTSIPGDVQTEVDIEQGSVSVRVPEHAHTPVIVRTVDGSAIGEGGFRVHVEPDASRTEALYAPVQVVGATGSLRLDAGEGTRVRKGGAPDSPVKLLPPGTPVLPGDDDVLRRPDFTWRPVDRALGYRVEVSLSPAFGELVVVEDVARPSWTPEMLVIPYRVPGMWWRISSFDRTGFLGLPGDPRHLVHPAGTGL